MKNNRVIKNIFFLLTSFVFVFSIFNYSMAGVFADDISNINLVKGRWASENESNVIISFQNNSFSCPITASGNEAHYIGKCFNQLNEEIDVEIIVYVTTSDNRVSFFLPKGTTFFKLEKNSLFTTTNGASPSKISFDRDHNISFVLNTSNINDALYSKPEKNLISIGNAHYGSEGVNFGGVLYAYQISFCFSSINGTWNSQMIFSGKVYDASGENYSNALILCSKQPDETNHKAVSGSDAFRNVVDTTVFKLSVFVEDSSFKTFKINKNDVFTETTISGTSLSGASSVYFDNDYLISYTRGSEITVTNLSIANSSFGVDEDAPEIIYEGQKKLTYKEGQCVPLLFAQAIDNVDGDILVKKTWSVGAYDSNYKLKKGEHVITLTATDKSGNTGSLKIQVSVK